MLSVKGPILVWGGFARCNTTGPPVNLWTKGTVGRQIVLSVHCVRFVPVTSVLLSVSLSL
jgi:hypothetical protein